jgi:hypothetical protein
MPIDTIIVTLPEYFRRRKNVTKTPAIPPMKLMVSDSPAVGIEIAKRDAMSFKKVP